LQHSGKEPYTVLFVCLLRSPLATAKAVAILPGVYTSTQKIFLT